VVALSGVGGDSSGSFLYPAGSWLPPGVRWLATDDKPFAKAVELLPDPLGYVCDNEFAFYLGYPPLQLVLFFKLRGYPVFYPLPLPIP